MRTPHLSTKTGKRIFVKLHNGERFVDKFVEKKSNVVIFEKKGKILTRDILAFSIYRQNVRPTKQ